MTDEDHGFAMFHHEMVLPWRRSSAYFCYVPIRTNYYILLSNAKMQPASGFTLVVVGPIDITRDGGVLLV